MNLTLLNETILNKSAERLNSVMQYAPNEECFDWCIVQQVRHSNNMELYGILFVVMAYFCILAYYFLGEFEQLRPFRENFIYYAKLLLLLFFGFYILIIRMRLIW